MTSEQDIKDRVAIMYPFVAKTTWLGPATDCNGDRLIAAYVEDYSGRVIFAPFMLGIDWSDDNIRAQFHRWNDEEGVQLKADLFIAFPMFAPNYTPRCDCGAKSTSNPNCHSHWCSVGGIK
jgi:hypothetical protein